MNGTTPPLLTHRAQPGRWRGGLAAAVLGLAAAQAAAADDVAAGKAAFSACSGCHAVGPSARAGFGPALNGVVGRAAGASPDYRYSPAMKNAKLVWSEPVLAAFIRDPDATVPGTRMRFSSFGWSDRKIAQVIAYLRTVPATP